MSGSGWEWVGAWFSRDQAKNAVSVTEFLETINIPLVNILNMSWLVTHCKH